MLTPHSQQTYPIAARITYNYYINTSACGRRQIEYRYLLRIHFFVYCKNKIIVVAAVATAAAAADLMLLRCIFHFVYHNKFMHRILSDRERLLGGSGERGTCVCRLGLVHRLHAHVKIILNELFFFSGGHRTQTHGDSR